MEVVHVSQTGDNLCLFWRFRLGWSYNDVWGKYILLPSSRLVRRIIKLQKKFKENYFCAAQVLYMPKLWKGIILFIGYT